MRPNFSPFPIDKIDNRAARRPKRQCRAQAMANDFVPGHRGRLPWGGRMFQHAFEQCSQSYRGDDETRHLVQRITGQVSTDRFPGGYRGGRGNGLHQQQAGLPRAFLQQPNRTRGGKQPGPRRLAAQRGTGILGVGWP